METDAKYTIAGAFVVLLTAAIIFAVIWFSSGVSPGSFTIYQVDMQEAVSGLNTDAAVEYNGVNVGRVKSITLNHRNPRLVELLLSIKNDTPITQGTLAKLNVRGLTGISFIALKDQGNNLTPLRRLPGHRYPIIQTEPSFLLQMDKAVNILNENVKKVAQAIQALLNPENLRLIHQTLLHVSAVTGALEGQTIPGTMQLMQRLNETAENMATISDQIRENPALLIRGKTPYPLGPGEK